jgi:hypothetical protein
VLTDGSTFVGNSMPGIFIVVKITTKIFFLFLFRGTDLWEKKLMGNRPDDHEF